MSDKPVAEKLLIRPGASVWSSDASLLRRLGGLPDGVREAASPDAADVAVLFAGDAASLRAALDAERGHLPLRGALWIAYPKGGRADINRDSIWPIVGAYGMRPNGQVALDATWSALRFRALREGEAPFAGGA